MERAKRSPLKKEGEGYSISSTHQTVCMFTLFSKCKELNFVYMLVTVCIVCLVIAPFDPSDSLSQISG